MDVDLKANIRTVDRWILNMGKDLLITEKKPFAEGNFGEVYHGKLLPENRDVAVKKIRDDAKTKSWNDEIEAIKTLQHENIVLLHG